MKSRRFQQDHRLSKKARFLPADPARKTRLVPNKAQREDGRTPAPEHVECGSERARSALEGAPRRVGRGETDFSTAC